MLGHRDGAGDQLVGLDETVQKADLVKALGGETKAQRHLHRDRIGQVRDMPVVVAADQPALRLGDLEHRTLGRDPQIGALDQHEAAAHRIAVDRGDDRLFKRPGHKRVFDVRPAAARAPGGEQFLHVLAGAEPAAGPGEDRDFELARMAEFGPGLGEPGAHLVIERVQPLGAVHPHDEDLSQTLGLDDGHVFLPFSNA